MSLFYAPEIVARQVLPEDEAVHALRVLRLHAGSEITLTDGKGFFYLATIRHAHPKQCEVTLLKRWQPAPPAAFQIHMAVAPTKHTDRMEWLIEKVTEIGIHAVTLLNCRFSERREMKTVRLQKVAVSAMKQSQQAFLPQLTGMTPFPAFAGQPFDGRKFIACCERKGMDRPLLNQLYRAGEHALILIGPEGDFSPEEVTLALASGFTPVSLGPHRLRTETAALVACHTIHVLNGGNEIHGLVPGAEAQPAPSTDTP
ncbi:MAG: 16S rRNA (uracil(1498)-N(3))-methyltransferase [Tannerella sp.]|jgi:16S rRNA (uracil1498-N3)-methyltransferase|nr:16S rRNA (uracil(1498)-N(3))-methyltransferase [Tannerella sp.]